MIKLPKISLQKILLIDLLLSILILVIETTAKSIVMLFASPKPEILYPAFYNYYELKPFGYGNIFPILIFFFSIGSLFYSLVQLFPKKRHPYKVEQTLLRLCILFNLLPYLFFWGGCRISISALVIEGMFIAKYWIYLHYKKDFKP